MNLLKGQFSAHMTKHFDYCCECRSHHMQSAPRNACHTNGCYMNHLG